MNNVVSINNHNLQVKEYRGQRVVTFKDIDVCHEKAEGSAKRRFNDNKERFIRGVDYYEISKKDVGDDFARTYGFNEKAPKGYVLTESGYMMLVKSFTDDLAWNVQRMLVNTYFQKKQEEKVDPNKLLEAQAKFMNAKTRMASLWLKLGDRVPSNKEYQQICNSYASEALTGEKVLPLPECHERYYTATEIAEMIGSSHVTVGKKAKAAGIRPVDENAESIYGKWFFDKSPSSNKQVCTFKYNDLGLEKVKELFSCSRVALSPVQA